MTLERSNVGINKAEASAQGAGKSVPPMGCSESSQRRSENRRLIVDEIMQSAHTLQQGSPYVASGILGFGPYQWNLSLQAFEEHMNRVAERE